MRKIIVCTNLTLDGVMQAPGRPDEDRRDGFEYGGWGAPYAAMQSSEAGENLSSFGALLLGRRTYQSFYDFWPKQTDSPFSERLKNIPKFVASRTLSEPLPWENSTLLGDDLPQTLTELVSGAGPDIVVMGSGDLIQTLIKHNLIDNFVLLIHPLVLGTGRRLFPEDGERPSIQLVSAKATPNGVVVATYQPA